MNIKKIAVTLSLGAVALSLFAAPLLAAQLTDQNKQFLAAYDKVHHALVADDLAGAKSAAKDLGDEGRGIVQAATLQDARSSFEKLSERAKILAAGQPGYHIFHCPMKNKDWVQTSTTIANPYGGKGMISCGEIKK